MSATTQLPLAPGAILGRETELNQIRSLLCRQDVRLLTLTGPGGVGKTRLALEAAANLECEFEDGVYFAPLDQLNDPKLVSAKLAQACRVTTSGGQSFEESLIAHLQPAHALILIDNYEHLLDAATLPARLLSVCPRLKILTTSRAPLRLRGEQEYPIDPLRLPDLNEGEPLERIKKSSAVSLFVERAAAVMPSFQLTPENAAAIAKICVLLDGLPLAIELAAARVKLFSPQVLIERLQDGFALPGFSASLKLLTSGARDLPVRQRTLQNTLEWSYCLLSGSEQALFRRLGVFAGGFTPEAVEALYRQNGYNAGDILEGLAALVEQSLARRDETDPNQARFSMLYVLKQFALGQLEAEGELEVFREGHARHFLFLAEQVEPDQPGRIFSESDVSLEAISRAAVEQANLRAALQWSLASDNTELALRLVNALDKYWYYHSMLQERCYWEEAVIAKTTGRISLRRGKALRNLAMTLMMIRSGDGKWISQYLEDALSIYRSLGDPLGVGAVLSDQGLFETSVTGNFEKALGLFKESAELARGIDSKVILIRDLTNLAWVLLLEGELDQAFQYLQECQALCRDTRDLYGIAFNEDIFGWITQRQGKLGEALRYAFESIGHFRSLGTFNFELSSTMMNLSEIAGRTGEGRCAAEFCGLAQKLINTLNMDEPADMRQLFRTAKERARSVAGEAEWEAGFAAGLALAAETAGDWALDQIAYLQARLKQQSGKPKAPAQNGTRPVNPGGLTAREMEILQLISQGLSDFQVAKTLVISPRTVNAHLTSIYSKLGVNSRAAATRFAIENGLV